jgi:cysteine desulfurase/selenocysteine lyase
MTSRSDASASVKPASDAERFRSIREAEYSWMSGAIYVNNAGIGPLPARTRRAIAEFQDLRAEPHRLGDGMQMEILARARAAAARLIGAEPTEIGLAPNTTFGINMAARSLRLGRGDVVVVSDREFPANVYPWLQLRENGVEVELAPVTPDGWPDERHLLERITDPRVRVVAVSMVQFANGYRADLDRLGAACRAHDTTLVVDAIQGLGQVPLDVRKTPIDILASGAQKWLLSPWGSGFLYVRRGLVERLTPAMAGWLAFEGTDDFSRLTDYRTEFRADARRFEVGTVPYQDVLGMTTSIELLLEIGVERIERHLAGLRRILHTAADGGALRLVSPPEGPSASAIVCVRPRDADACFVRLRAAGVTSARREGAIRVSPHFFNTSEEIERVVELLAEA